MPEKHNPGPTASPGQLRSVLENNLTFTLGSEEFGIQVLHIREASPNPLARPGIEGLVTLGGQVCGQPHGPYIPVAGLSVDFNFRPRAYTDRTCIVVVRTQPPPPNGCNQRLLRTLAEGVAETLDIASDDIELAPDFGDGAPLPYLLGMARIRGKVKLLQHPIHALLKLTGDS